MTKEMYVSSTPHETKVAVVEDDQLAEIFFERENEYTLAGSIYKGRVTRVLPGMQSAFVDIGLERDAFLYVSDFLDLEEEEEDFEEVPAQNFVNNKPQQESRDFDFQKDSRRVGATSGEEPDQLPEAGAQESAQGGYHRDDFRGGRRRRRGRRGRGFPDSKFDRGSQEEGEAVAEDFGAPESYPPIVLPGESISKYQKSGGEGYEASAEPRDSAQSGESFVIEGGFDEETPEFESAEAQKQFPEPEGPRHADIAPAQQPAASFILPGESISKYKAKRDDEQPAETTPAVAGQETAPETQDSGSPALSTQTEAAEVHSPAPPVRRVNLPPAPLVLPGESIAKYRKPEPPQAAPDTPAAIDENHPSAPQQEPVETHLGEESKVDHPAPVPEQPVVVKAPQEPRAEVRMDRRSVVAPFILPGESIAKYRRIQEKRAQALETEIAKQPEDKLAEEAEQMVASNEPLAVTLEREIAAETAAATQAEPSSERPELSDVPESLVTEHGSIGGLTEPALTPASRDENESSESQRVSEQVESEQQFETEQKYEQLNVASTFGGETAESDEVQPEPEHVSRQETDAAAADGEAPSVDHPEPFASSQPEIDDDTRAFIREAQGFGGGSAASTFRHPFAPGEGDLEEEEIDEEDETDYRMYSHDDDSSDYVELEEETLERSEPHVSEQQHSAQSNAEQVEANGLTDAIEDEIIDERTSEAAYPPDNNVGEHGIQIDTADLSEEFEESEMESGAAPAAGAPEHRHGSRPHFDRRRFGRRPPGGRPMRPARRESRPVPLISDLLKEGQEVLIQIAKEPIGKKGARITSHIALPGRFLVYMPTVNHIGVSRKINSDDERQRLKRIMLSEREGGHGGFIVRTAAAGVGEDELRADIRFLKTLWSDIKHRFETGKAPALIYHDLNLVERILRDQVTSDFAALWVDTEQEYERLVRFANRFQPQLVRKIKLYTKSTPLFEQFNIQSELDKALKSKVWLKSGGYIVINQTEALVAIDINTGKYVGKTARLEDTIVKTNIDAIKEIVRQIRLRDLGGIIVIDFIDMDERKNRQKVMQALEEALRADRAPSKVLQFNDFGLVAITRKRVKQSLERTLGEPCPHCTGTGLVKSVTTVCNEVYVEMRKMVPQLEKNDVLLRVNPEVGKALKAQGGRWIQEMEEMTKKNILIKSDPLLHQEHFDIEG